MATRPMHADNSSEAQSDLVERVASLKLILTERGEQHTGEEVNAVCGDEGMTVESMTRVGLHVDEARSGRMLVDEPLLWWWKGICWVWVGILVGVGERLDDVVVADEAESTGNVKAGPLTFIPLTLLLLEATGWRCAQSI